MGNNVSHRPSASTGKVFLSDGSVHEYGEPLTVAELMMEHPGEVVVEIRSVLSGKRPSPLPADKKLETNEVYIMLPMRRSGKPAALSAEEAHRLLLKANSVLKSRSLFSSSGFLPLFALICKATVPAAGTAGERRENGFMQHGKEKMLIDIDESKNISGHEWFSEVLSEGRPEFLSRQISGKGWKPSLDTIREKSVKTKVVRRHWLF